MNINLLFNFLKAYNTWAKKMAQVVENREDVVRPEPLVAFEGYVEIADR